MIALLLGNWKLVLIGLVAAAVGGYIWHCESAKADLAASIALAQAQAAANAKQAHRDLLNKERSDENYLRNMARLRADLKRLRQSSASVLPSGGATPGDPDRICFDRGQLDRALRGFIEGAAGLVAEGDAAVIGLDEAKAWAQNR